MHLNEALPIIKIIEKHFFAITFKRRYSKACFDYFMN